MVSYFTLAIIIVLSLFSGAIMVMSWERHRFAKRLREHNVAQEAYHNSSPLRRASYANFQAIARKSKELDATDMPPLERTKLLEEYMEANRIKFNELSSLGFPEPYEF